jgi:DNA-binding transcriptional MerR regulator
VDTATDGVTRPLTVGALARLSGVTVRTLHHYDETGLLRPSDRTDAGYRLYDGDDVARLQRILFYRELGFSLEDVAELLDDPATDPVDHLARQHELLGRRIARLEEMRAAVALNLEARQMGIDLTPDEMLEVFGEEYTAKHAAYQAEAEERWGDTDAWAQSHRRTSRYTAQDWKQAMAEQQAATEGLAAALRAGVPADGEQAMDAAEAHRQQITRWFYDCSYEIHRGLGDMYVQDPRFTRTYEDVEEGLARYVRDAIHATADRATEG